MKGGNIKQTVISYHDFTLVYPLVYTSVIMIICLIAELWLGHSDRIFWVSFCPFTPLMDLTSKIFKNKKKNA